MDYISYLLCKLEVKLWIPKDQFKLEIHETLLILKSNFIIVIIQ